MNTALSNSVFESINTIAVQAVKANLKRHSWMDKEHSAEYVKQELRELLAIRQALIEGRYYTRVDTVAKSGMSRTIEICYIADNKLHSVTDTIYRLAGCDKNRRISGCGMDMLFAAQYNIFVELCPDLRYQDSMQRYNSL